MVLDFNAFAVPAFGSGGAQNRCACWLGWFGSVHIALFGLHTTSLAVSYEAIGTTTLGCPAKKGACSYRLVAMRITCTTLEYFLVGTGASDV